MAPTNSSIAVLTSGGLDSAILVADLALGDALGDDAAVYPLYLREGLYWEPVELECLQRFLASLTDRNVHPTVIRPLTVLEMPVKDLYGEHWSVTGRNVPDAATPDDAVYLPGRNLFFLAKAMTWCRLHDVPEVALATLASNPFPDASDRFFDGMEELAALALGGRVRIRRPYAGLHKNEVLQRGRDLPLEWTFSCMRPTEGRHCGRCNKCAERKKAFGDAGLPDPTRYVEP